MFITKVQDLSREQHKLVEQFSKKVQQALPHYTLRHIHPEQAGDLLGSENIVIALGSSALQVVNSGKGDSPVIGVFISRSSFESHQANTTRSTAVFSNPSPTRQMALIKALLGDGASVGMLHSTAIEQDVDEAVAAAKRLDIEAKVVNFNKKNTAKQVIDAFKSVKTLLLIKDREIFEHMPLETLLVIGYDINNLGMIGYSSGMVENGALATTYTSLDDTVSTIEDFVMAMEKNQRLPRPQYAKHYSVSVNKYVMRSLGIPELDAPELRVKLESLLGQGK
ncbi:MAG: hypothetical protein KTR20_00900 [Cellvibrionaceae bacterium]|nr:hypothetical protein [Cellvibrionaceae bacterium]